MIESIVVENVTCPLCGNHVFSKDMVEQGIYRCLTPNNDPNDLIPYCHGMLFYCKKCDKYYPENMFGKHGDVYECKECGTVHWGQTERKQGMAETASKLSSMSSYLSSFKNKYGL